MKVKCDFCGNYIEDTESSCPHCGGVNSAAGNRRFSNGVPKTIEEIRRNESHTVSGFGRSICGK